MRRLVLLAVFFQIFAASSVHAQSGRFLEAQSYPLSSQPSSSVVGDFNGDGFVDLAVAEASPSVVTVLLASADGSFRPTGDFPLRPGPTELATADLNGDGKLDLISTAGDAYISVSIGNGDGTFGPRTDFSLPSVAYTVTAADFNGDGKMDVVAPGDTISVLLGDGEGGFLPYSILDTNGVAAVSDDFNHDRIPDLAIASTYYTGVVVYLGKGDGTFASGFIYGTGAYPDVLAKGDLDHDGNADLVVPNWGQDTVTVLLGKADGTFEMSANYSIGRSPTRAAIADFDNDGKLDFAVTTLTGSKIAVFWGNGNGTFANPPSMYTVGDHPTSLQAFDANADGTIDLLTSNYGDHNLTMVFGNGDRTFQAGQEFGDPDWLSFKPSSGTLADFNGDGELDLVFTTSFGPWFMALGSGDGAFLQAQPFLTQYFVGSVLSADLNHDGYQDLALGSAGPGILRVLLGRGDGTFPTQIEHPLTADPGCIRNADLNGDGNQDLVMLEFMSLGVVLGRGDGTFQPEANYPLSHRGFCVVLSDIDGDGHPDVVLLGDNSDGGVVGVFFVNADGTLRTEKTSPVVSNPHSIAAGDLNYDGRSDLAITSASKLTIYLGQGDGSFGPGVQYVSGDVPGEVAMADINKDGKLDVVVASSCYSGRCYVGSAAVYYGKGDGTLNDEADDLTGYGPSGLVLGDLNSDGATDLVTINWDGGTVSTLLNTGGTRITLDSSNNPANLGQEIVFSVSVTSSVLRKSAPSGNVTLLDRGTAIASTTLGESGAATFRISNLSAGTHQVSLSYGGNDLFLVNTSSTLVQVVNAPDVSVGVSPLSPSSLRAGQSATAQITITPAYGFSGTVSLSCSVSPSPAKAPTCSVQPNSITTEGSSSATATLNLNTTAPTTASYRNSPMRVLAFYTLGLPLCGIFFSTLVVPQRKRHQLWWLMLLLVCLVAVVLVQSGCGGSSAGSSSTPGGGIPGTPSGNYTVTLAVTSGTITHTSTVNFTLE